MTTKPAMTKARADEGLVRRLRDARCDEVSPCLGLLHDEAADRITLLEAALKDIIGNANEAMPTGPFDCIDNTGAPYQSEAFCKALERGRKLLSDTALTNLHQQEEDGR